MTEFNYGQGRVESLMAELGQEAQRRESYSGQISAELRAIAEQAVARYRRIVDTEHDNAVQMINEVIQPWFTQLVQTDTIDSLSRSQRHVGSPVRFSEAIIHYWPRKALQRLDGDDSLTYSELAAHILSFHGTHDISKWVKWYADSDEVWYAGIQLEHSWRGSTGVKIWRQPTIGAGFAFAHQAHKYDIHLDVHNIQGSIAAISPEVWVAFGQQIASGQVWDTIAASLQPQRTAVISRSEYEQRTYADRQKYLQDRQWYD